MNLYNKNYFAARLPEDARRNMVWEELTRLFNRWLPPVPECVIEIGAGYCVWINVAPGKKRYAVDVADTVVAHAGEGVTPIIGSATSLTFASDASADVVLASNILEHLTPDEVERALQEIFRVLRPGGKICIMQPNFRLAWKEYFDDYTHRTIFTDAGLCSQLESHGFRIVKKWRKLVPFSFKSTSLPVPRFLVRAYLNSPWKPRAKQMAVIAKKP